MNKYITIQYEPNNIIQIFFVNNSITLKHKNNKYFVISYSCDNCNQSDIYLLCYSIYKAIKKCNPNDKTKIYYKINEKINNRNMFLLLHWKLYMNNKKISIRKIKNIENNNLILKTKFNSLKKNLKIFNYFYENQKMYKYIYVFNNK